MNRIKKTISAAFMLLVLSSTYIVSSAQQKVVFSDLPETYWAYKTVTEMTAMGLFKGTTEPINGVGTFSPDKEMTRAEFVTVALRATYPRKSLEIKTEGSRWWQGFYDLALQTEIIKQGELENGDLTRPISRQEMAMIVVRCAENSGEKLVRRVKTSQIADFDKVGAFYQRFVVDCFSYGIICGVDSLGTFAPNKTLTRAEAATVLLRLINPDKRIVVNFLDDSQNVGFVVGGSNGENDGADKDTGEENGGIDSGVSDNKPPVIEVPDELPWENGGKQPDDYSWKEFEALPAGLQIAFQSSFKTDNGFDEWMQRVRFGDVNRPWESGGKQPKDYTWEEFEALTAGQQIAFQDSFASFDAFDEWMQKAQFGSSMPWENGGKQPKDYTWEEFEALTASQQIAFQNSFLSIDEFDKWLQKAQFGESTNPWENGGKQPKDYSWEEFEMLTAGQQIAFQEAFDSFEDFDEWLQRVQPE